MAIDLALKTHKGVTDKKGFPYILHVLNVGLAGETEDEIVAGILHDAVEDSDGVVSLDTLVELGFNAKVVSAVDSVTKRKGETYLGGFIERCKLDPVGIKVKINDLKHNLRPDRSMNIPGWESLVKKYNKALDRLQTHLDILRKEKELKRLKESLE